MEASMASNRAWNLMYVVGNAAKVTANGSNPLRKMMR